MHSVEQYVSRLISSILIEDQTRVTMCQSRFGLLKKSDGYQTSFGNLYNEFDHQWVPHKCDLMLYIDYDGYSWCSTLRQTFIVKFQSLDFWKENVE